jgi:hypothetical protein
MKSPPQYYTIIVTLGPGIPSFQQHFAQSKQAGQVLGAIKAKMRPDGAITNVQLWYKGTMVASHHSNPPTVTWIPPKDENGVRHIPEGKSGFTPISPFHIADWTKYGKDGEGKVRKVREATKRRMATQDEVNALEI